jgi:hypothetical protein
MAGKDHRFVVFYLEKQGNIVDNPSAGEFFSGVDVY